MNDDASELKKEMQRVIDCAFKMQDHRVGWRFSFRVSNETLDRWKELVK